MLLRLVPAPTQEHPQPPTVLFSLHLPHQPYTAKGLPLPAALLAHQAACSRHALPCVNPLLGDKASWLAAVVHQVSFYPAEGTIRIQLVLSDGDDVDGKDEGGIECELPLGRSCREMCEAVMAHVTQSLAPPPPPASPTAASPIAPLSPPMTPRLSSSSFSFPQNDIKRHSPSSLLMSLLSPLLPSSSPGSTCSLSPTTTTTAKGFSSQQRTASQQGKPTTTLAHQRSADPQRFHRRQARSLLVDAFTRFVLPGLKRRLRAMCYRDIEGTVSTIDGSAGYLALALALQVQKKRREWHAVRGEVEQLLLLAANAANTTASGDGNAPMHVVVGGALRRPSLGGSLGRRNATERLDTVDWNTSETSSEGSLTEAQVSSSNVTAYQTASQRTTYHSSLPPSTSLPSRLAQRYATAHNRLGACTSALAALERYAFSDLRGDQVRRASWGKEEARRVEERAVRKSVGDTVWNAQSAAVGVHEIGDPAGIMARVARQSGLRNCVYSAAAARKPVRNDGGGFAPRIHVWPISPSCASLVLDTHRSSSFADGPVGGHRSKSEDGEDVVSDGTDDDGQGATSDRLQSSLVTAFQDFCDSATDPAPALAFTHSAESFDSSSSSWTDDNSCGDANVDCISPIYEGPAPPIEDALFLFSPKHAVASTHQLAPPCFACPSPLLDPIDLLPPTCTALPPAVEILHHHHHHHDDDEADGDPVGIRREGIWVDVLSGRRKSGSAAATAPDDMEVAPPGWGGFFGWLQQQQTYFPPAAAAAAC